METEEIPEVEALRDRAIKRLKKRRDLAGHVLVYLLVNTFLVGIWILTGRDGFFWPIFLIGGWGIGVLMNAWDVFRGEDFDEVDIRQEMRRLQEHR
jgi:hypothetical protein